MKSASDSGKPDQILIEVECLVVGEAIEASNHSW